MMPQLQTLNFDEGPSALERTLEGFAQRRQQHRETDALREIYNRYQKEGNDIDGLMFNYLNNPDISPTARVQGINTALEMKKTNAAIQKESRERAEKAEKEAREKEEARAETRTLIEMNPDLSPEQKRKAIESDSLTPTSARELTREGTRRKNVEYDMAADVHKRFEPSLKEYATKASSSKSSLPALDAAIVNNEKYDTSSKLWDTTIDATNSPFLQQFKSRTGQELESITPIAVSSFGAKMGGQLTNQKMRLIEKKAVGLGKDKSANRMLLYMDKYDRELDLLRNKFANEIMAENEYGLADKDFELKLDKKLFPYQKMISEDINALLEDQIPTSPMSHNRTESDTKKYKMRAPSGEIGYVPYNRVNDAIAKGAEFVRSE